MCKMTECRKLVSLICRNTKYYFKNKFLFFISLLTPIILLILFVTFLRNVYIESFTAAFPEGFEPEKRITEGLAGAWLMSSVLSVSSVTVAFCSNTIMIDDKINSAINDFSVSPVKSTTVSIGYFISNFFVTFLVIMCVMCVGHIYLAAVGWYIPVGDAFMIIVDSICCILFGSLLAGVVESFISNAGGLSAVSTLVSSMYGFICGAYMPLSQFSEGLRTALGFLPGTYGVGIMRNHYMNGYISALADAGVPDGALSGLRDAFDANLYMFGNEIPLWAMYVIVLGASVVLLGAYLTIIILKGKRNNVKKRRAETKIAD